MVHLYVFEKRFDLGTLDSGERSLPFGLLVLINVPSLISFSSHVFIRISGLRNAPFFSQGQGTNREHPAGDVTRESVVSGKVTVNFCEFELYKRYVHRVTKLESHRLCV